MKILRLIDNVHMGLGHVGLAKLSLEKFKLDLSKLPEGDLVMFLNTGRDKLKIIGKGGLVIGYLRMPHGKRIMIDAIQYIPQTFNGQGFSYDDALKKALTERLAKTHFPKGVSPLEAFRTTKRAANTARTH